VAPFARSGEIVNDEERGRNIVNDVVRAVSDIVNDVSQARPGEVCHKGGGLSHTAVTGVKQS